MAIKEDYNFNDDTQREKVRAGYKGGPFFKNPILHPHMGFEEDSNEGVAKAQSYSVVPEIPIEDTWWSKRAK